MVETLLELFFAEYLGAFKKFKPYLDDLLTDCFTGEV